MSSTTKSDDYYQILRDKVNTDLINSSFNSNNLNFDSYCLNKSTISYFPTFNHLFIIEREDKKNCIKFYLWGFSLEPIEQLKKSGPVCKRYSITLENEENKEFEIPKDLCLEILNNSNYNEEFFVLYGGSFLFGNFFLDNFLLNFCKSG